MAIWVEVPRALGASGLLVLVDEPRSRLSKDGVAETLSEGVSLKLRLAIGGRRADSRCGFPEANDPACSAVCDEERFG